MIAKAIIQKLLLSADVSVLVGDRIEPNILKQTGEYPAIYVSVDRMTKLPCRSSNNTRTGIIEIGVYADAYGAAGGVIEAIRKSLDDFSGFIDDVGITISGGKESPDLFDDVDKKHVKTIEYEAVAQIYTNTL